MDERDFLSDLLGLRDLLDLLWGVLERWDLRRPLDPLGLRDLLRGLRERDRLRGLLDLLRGLLDLETTLALLGLEEVLQEKEG